MSSATAVLHRARSPSLPRYELIGPSTAPLVIVLGGISASAHVTSTPSNPAPGWWDAVVGPGRVIDTERFRVLSFDWLDESVVASSQAVTTHDQAAALARLLDALGIDQAYAVVGASYGGMVALAFAERYGARLEQLIAVSAAHESSPMSTGLRAIQRRIVALGLESGRVKEALAIARALGMTTYRSAAEFADRFAPVEPEPDQRGVTFAVERYLMEHGERFAQRFDARRFCALSLSCDLHRVDPAAITVPTLLVAADWDTLVPREQIEELASRLTGPSRIERLETRVGHDAFLAEPAAIGQILTVALSRQTIS